MELGEINVWFVQANEYDDESGWWTLGNGCYATLDQAEIRLAKFKQEFPGIRTRVVRQTTTNKVV